MLANDLLNLLERRGLLDQEIIEALREQLAQSGARVTPEKFAQLLVDNGQLTRFQATKLIGEVRSAVEEEGGTPEGAADSATGSGFDSGELDLADGFGSGDSDADVVEAELIDDDDDVVEVEAEPIEVEAVEATDVSDYGAAVANRPKVPRGPRTKKVNLTKQKRDESKSVWDSFKIYGVAGIVVLLLLVSGLLFFVLRKGNADEFIARANQAYNQQAYAAAEKEFGAFLDNFGNNHPHSSIARTRLTMSQMYQFAQYTDPVRAVDEAERLLPTIEDEDGLEEERNNLAQLLVDIADNIARAAGATADTSEKQRLLNELDRQIRMTENPLYVTASARRSLSAKLQGVGETRARVQRDINRNLRLDESVTAMEAALSEQKTDEAYQTRKQLLTEFPELRTNERLVSLVRSASEIQQTLVKTATRLPRVETDLPAAEGVRNVVLTNRGGSEVPGLRDEVIYVRAHGAILAFAAVDGRLLWRRYVGYGQNHAPLAIGDGGLDGVLLSDADDLEIRRCEATTGDLLWRASIGEAFSQPVTHREDIFVSTASGRVISLDAQTGEARWATQIPQPLERSPGVNDRPGKLYLTGNHSNLYVMERRSGKCTESFYLGHAPGTIAVPPVALQSGDTGHVFVFENAGSDFAYMHVLKCNATGGALTVAQPPFRLVGNVMVDPILVLGRRLIVLTDRAEIVVFDIEQTAATAEQVSQVAKQVASYDSPTSAQMAVDRNQMWISGTRLGRYDLQVATGRVARDWVINEGDAFIGQPQVIGEALFHARVLRGTSGVRVTAAEPKSGKPFWQTDVGVPVAMIQPVPEARSYHVITSQAALFELNQTALSEGETTAPIENPGGAGVAMRFEFPSFIDERRAVLLNGQTGGQLAVYDPTRAREKLRLITLSLPEGKPSGAGLIAGNGYLLPLDSGRIVLMNWQTGGALGSPFQPPSDPNQKVTWSDPVALPDDPDQVLIADSRKKIYRLRVGEQVRELASADLESHFLGRAVILGDQLFATTAGPAADFLVSHDTGSLDQASRRLLDGRVLWGPYAADDHLLLMTDDGNLRAFDQAGEPVFTIPAGDRDLVDGLSMHEGQAILCGRRGRLLVVDLAAGQLVGKSDLSQPLSGPAFVTGRRLLVPGQEGVVYITEIPTTVEEP